MTDDNVQWGDKPNKPDHVHKRIKTWEEHLAEDQRNPNAKETFDEAVKRAAQPAPSKPGKRADPGSRNGK